jgi:N-acyl-D-aspartate/D-glutamate deacylase
MDKVITTKESSILGRIANEKVKQIKNKKPADNKVRKHRADKSFGEFIPLNNFIVRMTGESSEKPTIFNQSGYI